MSIKTATQLFYIQNKGFVGNCLIWWREGGHGYTCNLKEAWKVTAEKALDVCSIRDGEDVCWPVDEIDKIAQSHVSSESLCEFPGNQYVYATKDNRCV